MNVRGAVPVLGFTPEKGKAYGTVMCVVSHPLSRGSVHISSANPSEPPSIDPNYFATATDLNIMVQTIEFALRLIDTEPISKIFVAKAAPKLDSGKERKEIILDHIRNACGTSYHPVGTAAMLPRECGGVVDSKLLVYGTDNLRVVNHVSFD